jgi:uncharacterized protein (DUF1800 family)/fibronectin type 3 domain-containing protein
LDAESSTGRVVLDWARVADAHGYRVFRAVAGVWSPEPIGTVFHSRYVNFRLTNGTLYSYKVVAFNRGGNGPPSNVVDAMPLAPPADLTATPGNREITLKWQSSPGAMSYAVYRRVGHTHLARIGAPVTGTTFVDTGLTNGTLYHYRVRALTGNGDSDFSNHAAATPTAPTEPPPVAAPQNLTATPGNGQIQLSWSAVAGAVDYRIFRATNGVFGTTPIATVATLSFLNTGLTNGTPYSYRVAAHNGGGDGPLSAEVTASPLAVLAAPTNLSATAGNAMVTLSWTAVTGATSYNVYRGTTANGQSATPTATLLTTSAFVDSAVSNGVTYFYKVTSVNASGEGPRSAEASASPTAPTPPPPSGDPAVSSTFRFLRQTTWGPRPGDVERVRALGTDAFLAEQLAAPPSQYPAALFSEPLENAQEQFMAFALTGQDQLRQRMAWALHKIWVVSGVEVTNTTAILTYHGLLSSGAFGNYRDLMRTMTLNPAMGRYLNMLNNRSEASSGVPANENYARELLQLFTLGTARLAANGSQVLDGSGAPIPTYSEADVKALARLLTGWTFGDGNPATIPTRSGAENFRVPMEAVASFHDVTQKTFLGRDFPANQDAQQDLDQALDVIFEHANVAPFISRQLIQQFVTSNPSSGYVADIAAVFNGGGGGRGDLAAVLRAILTHPEASQTAPTSGKLSEPVLYAVSMLRALNATVTDHPFLSERVAEMGQRVLFPPSVFSYYSPGYRVRGTGTPPLGGPEFQILTSVTALERVNFAGSLLGNRFGTDVTVDYAPFTSLAGNAAALVDFCNNLFMGGAMSTEERNEIISAVNVTAASNPTERVRTALYLTIIAAQAQVDR